MLAFEFTELKKYNNIKINKKLQKKKEKIQESK
jgi:hypothetical protein